MPTISQRIQAGWAGFTGKLSGNKDVQRNLANYISPVQLQRIKQDIQSWRNAVNEAEWAYFPHRVKMQQMYIDTMLNEHVFSCVDRRYKLTTEREYEFYIKDGKSETIVDTGGIFGEPWFVNLLKYRIDAKLYGYTLISLGDIISDSFPELSFIQRWNISPDRLNVTSFQYNIHGIKFMDDPYRKWHIWIPTPSDTGSQSCGYGLLYKIAKTEIYLRNNLGFNADFIQSYGQPIRKGKTTKSNPKERDAFANALAQMGSDPWILLDEGTDELELVEAKSSGTGHKSYADLEARLEKKVSKVLLGHADALDSTPGKLGSGQDGTESPVQQALFSIQLEDGKDCENTINAELLPRMTELGLNLPMGIRFRFKNNREKKEIRDQEDKSNAATAQIAYTMMQAGLKMDAKYFSDRTGIPATDVQQQQEEQRQQQQEDNIKATKNIKNKLEKLYK